MSPYKGLPGPAFWKEAVMESDPHRMAGLYKKKFAITSKDRVATAGSCFAQHIARHLRTAGMKVTNAEPTPRGMTEPTAHRFGYALYSARYGNIYTARQLLQLVHEALSGEPRPDIVWEKDGRFFDALRPSVEPSGLASPEEVMLHRHAHLGYVRTMLQKVDVLVFTFGLTEAWIDRKSGAVYPTAPGVIAGHYDPARHAFKNFTFQEVYDDFLYVRRLLKAQRPTIKFILTVSPVPLTATASGKHALQATTYSKSVLRAVAGQLEQELEDVDYFPSYEIITNQAASGVFYKRKNMREVTDAGVEAAMQAFMREHAPPPEVVAQAKVVKKQKPPQDIVCDEMLLEAFAPT